MWSQKWECSAYVFDRVSNQLQKIMKIHLQYFKYKEIYNVFKFYFKNATLNIGNENMNN